MNPLLELSSPSVSLVARADVAVTATLSPVVDGRSVCAWATEETPIAKEAASSDEPTEKRMGSERERRDG